MKKMNSNLTDEKMEELIFSCFAAAKTCKNSSSSAESFIDVEEYENEVMYPEFAKWAKRANKPEIAKLFTKVAGEEKLHAVWLRELYKDIGIPAQGTDTLRAKKAISIIKENVENLFEVGGDKLVENALKVAIRVENREWKEIYPRFKKQALDEGNQKAASVYQRVIDSEKMHAKWFGDALTELKSHNVNAAS